MNNKLDELNGIIGSIVTLAAEICTVDVNKTNTIAGLIPYAKRHRLTLALSSNAGKKKA